MKIGRDFETFLGGPNEAIARRLHVTITPQKLIRLNRNMYAAMGRPSAVRLSYSRARDLIAIEPADARQAEAFPVMPDSCGWRINAAPFCRHFNIEVDSTRKFITPRPRRQHPLPVPRQNHLRRHPKTKKEVVARETINS